MELLTQTIENLREDLEEQLSANVTLEAISSLKKRLLILEDIKNNHPHYEPLRMCVRDISLTEITELGEAYCPESEIRKLENVQNLYIQENPSTEHAKVVSAIIKTITKELKLEAAQDLMPERLLNQEVFSEDY